MGPPNIKADAKRAFDVLKQGKIVITPSDVGYALTAVDPAPLEKIFMTKGRSANKRHPMMGTYEFHREVHIVGPLQEEIIRTITQDFQQAP